MKILKNRVGNISLISIVVSSAIGMMVAFGIMKLTSTINRSNKHTELKGDMLLLRQSLADTIDCDQTWTSNSVSTVTDCYPSNPNPKPLLLKNRSGGNVTGALSSGTFSPANVESDTTFSGSGAMGEYYLRAYCDTSVNSLVVRIAKKGGADFAEDPLTKRKMNWGNASSNPILGSATRLFCSSKFGSSACLPGSTFPTCNYANYKTRTAALTHILTPPPAKCNSAAAPWTGDHWAGQVFCPTGYRPTGGGANCQIPLPKGQGGFILTSMINGTGDGWYIDCCGVTALTTPVGDTIPDAVFVTCVPENQIGP
jgi:hypothetical protein